MEKSLSGQAGFFDTPTKPLPVSADDSITPKIASSAFFLSLPLLSPIRRRQKKKRKRKKANTAGCQAKQTSLESKKTKNKNLASSLIKCSTLFLAVIPGPGRVNFVDNVCEGLGRVCIALKLAFSLCLLTSWVGGEATDPCLSLPLYYVVLIITVRPAEDENHIDRTQSRSHTRETTLRNWPAIILSALPWDCQHPYSVQSFIKRSISAAHATHTHTLSYLIFFKEFKWH